MLGNLISGDWHIVEVISPFKKEFIHDLVNFSLERAEKELEKIKSEHPESKFELLLVISK